MSTPTVREMVATALKAQGFDGLYNINECACLIGDLGPCGEIQEHCQAGYKVPGCTCGEGCEWYIVAEKPTTEKGCPAADN